jgi:hypothetical protein
MNVISPDAFENDEPLPIEIDPPCELCGRAIEDLEVLIYLCAAELVAQWEAADPRDCWKQGGEPPLPTSIPSSPARPYRTPEATVNAFWYVAGLDDPDYLKRWLAEHPRDVVALQKLWETKYARA